MADLVSERAAVTPRAWIDGWFALMYSSSAFVSLALMALTQATSAPRWVDFAVLWAPAVSMVALLAGALPTARAGRWPTRGTRAVPLLLPGLVLLAGTAVFWGTFHARVSEWCPTGAYGVSVTTASFQCTARPATGGSEGLPLMWAFTRLGHAATG